MPAQLSRRSPARDLAVLKESDWSQDPKVPSIFVCV
jgi:hypothetical protein